MHCVSCGTANRRIFNETADAVLAANNARLTDGDVVMTEWKWWQPYEDTLIICLVIIMVESSVSISR